MAILWSLCRKTTTFWREVRTMAIILRLLQVCSSLLLVRMLALPYPTHIVLPLPFPSQPTRPQPSWRDAHTHTNQKLRVLHSACPMFRHTHSHNAHRAQPQSLSHMMKRAAGQDETLTFSSTRTFTLRLPSARPRTKLIACDGTLKIRKGWREKGEQRLQEKLRKKTAESVRKQGGKRRGRHELHRTQLTF